jgi:hypothetical protein
VIVSRTDENTRKEASFELTGTITKKDWFGKQPQIARYYITGFHSEKIAMAGKGKKRRSGKEEDSKSAPSKYGSIACSR